MLHRCTFQALAVGFCCLSVAGCGAPGHSASRSKSPVDATTRLRQARTVLNGFSSALVQHDVGRVRSFISPRYFLACNQYRAQGTRYLRCLLDDTPLPASYHIVRIERAFLGSKELIALVDYYLPNGRYQPFYLNLLPGPHGLWIDSGGLPRG